MNNLLKAKSEFRKKGVVLTADKTKQGGGGAWKFAGEDNFIKTIQAPLSECGLEYIATMDYVKELGVQTIKAILFHVDSGENITSTIMLPEVTPKKDKNGNPLYLDAEIERGKQFGYWSRTLGIRLLGLSDIDPEDVNNMPVDITDDKRSELLAKIDVVIKKTADVDKTTAWILKTFKTTSIESMSNEYLTSAINTIESKQNASA